MASPSGRKHGREKTLFAFLGQIRPHHVPDDARPILALESRSRGYPYVRSASFFEILFRLVLAPEIDFFENPIAEMAGAARGVNPPRPESLELKNMHTEFCRKN